MDATKKQPDLVSNRKAFHDYEILDTYEAGMLLLGTEIKSLRNHGGSLQDAYVDVKNSGLWLLNASISPYNFGNIHNHEERRPRKLLMHKAEITKLKKQVAEKGMTLIPLNIFLNKKGLAKLRVAVAKGKKAYDKRAALKDRDTKRAMQRGEESD